MGKQLLYDAIDAHSPIRFYKMDEASGATEAADSGSDGANLTHTNSPTVGGDGWTAGTKSVLYDKATDVTTGASASITDDQTVVIIFNTGSLANPPAQEFPLTNVVDANNRLSMRALTNGNMIIGHEYATDNLSAEHTDLYLSGDAWVMVSASFDHSGGTVLSYVNGVSAGTLGTAAPSGAAVAFNIGAYSPTGTFDYNGKVALVALINSALDGDEQAALWTAYDSVDPSGLRARPKRGYPTYQISPSGVR